MKQSVRKRSPWGIWWLSALIIPYFVWYNQVNEELASVLGREVPANGKWWNQLVPFWGIVGFWATANRLNEAHAAYNSSVRVSPFVAAVLAPLWFGSHNRYLQRRLNVLSDVQSAYRSASSADLTPAR